MKIPLLVLILSIPIMAQGPSGLNARRLRSGTAIPSGACSPGPAWTDFYLRTTTSTLYYCSAANVWSLFVAAGGATPGGSNTQVQFNDSSAFGGDAGFVYNKTTDTATLGKIILNDGTAAAPVLRFTTDSSAGLFAGSTSLVTPDAVGVAANNGGAVMQVQNRNAAGFSGIEYLDNSGTLAVFTGYRNGGTGEFRFNNVASSGLINFWISGAGWQISNSKHLVPSANNSFDVGASGTGQVRNVFLNGLYAEATITPPGTGGDQTINKAAGSVNLDGSALTITNSLVTTSSMVFCSLATVDATMKSVSCKANNGSITVTGNLASTDEVRINFLVIQPD